MMKIVYEYENTNEGAVVVQTDPQTRTIWANGGKMVNFPYLVQIITYDKVPGKKFSYGGIYKTGLIVLFANKPIESLEDTVYICPTEIPRHGLVCTPHQYDNKTFDTLEDLIFFVTGLWWQIEHSYLYANGNGPDSIRWQRATTDEVLKMNWGTSLTLRQALNKDYPSTAGYGRKGFAVSGDKIIDRSIKIKLELKL